MSAPENLPGQMAEKTNDQLLEMCRRPVDWLPVALDAAKAELRRRGVEASPIASPIARGPSPRPEGQPLFLRIMFGAYAIPFYALTIWLARSIWFAPSPMHSRLRLSFWDALILFIFLFSGIVSTWLAFRVPAVRRSVLGVSRRVSVLRQPLWLKAVFAFYALLFFACTPIASFLGVCFLANGGPGGSSNEPYTVWNVVDAFVCLLVPSSGLLFTWFALGGPLLRLSSSKKTDDYRGPRCVACGEPIEASLEICAKCGWTQPR